MIISCGGSLVMVDDLWWSWKWYGVCPWESWAWCLRVWLYLPCCRVDSMWGLRCHDNPWENVLPRIGVLSWWLNLYLNVNVHHLDQYLIAIVGAAQLIQSLTVLVFMAHLFTLRLVFLCCWWCAHMAGGGASVFTAAGLHWAWLPIIWVTAGISATCLAF